MGYTNKIWLIDWYTKLHTQLDSATHSYTHNYTHSAHVSHPSKFCVNLSDRFCVIALTDKQREHSRSSVTPTSAVSQWDVSVCSFLSTSGGRCVCPPAATSSSGRLRDRPVFLKTSLWSVLLQLDLLMTAADGRWQFAVSHCRSWCQRQTDTSSFNCSCTHPPPPRSSPLSLCLLGYAKNYWTHFH